MGQVLGGGSPRVQVNYNQASRVSPGLASLQGQRWPGGCPHPLRKGGGRRLRLERPPSPALRRPGRSTSSWHLGCDWTSRTEEGNLWKGGRGDTEEGAFSSWKEPQIAVGRARCGAETAGKRTFPSLWGFSLFLHRPHFSPGRWGLT